MRVFLKHPRFWGDLYIMIAMIGSNIGSAWAGAAYHSLISAIPGENSAPANVGFQVLAIVLLVLGVYLRSKYRPS